MNKTLVRIDAFLSGICMIVVGTVRRNRELVRKGQHFLFFAFTGVTPWTLANQV